MPEPERVVFKTFIRGAIEDVWREITRTDQPQSAMFNMRLDTKGLRPGAKICMRSPSGKTTAIVGEVLECEPPYRYVHTFRFTQFDDPPCTVIHELKPVAGGVEYTLIHENLTPGTKTAKQMQQGAALIGKTLKSVVETGRPTFGVRLLYRLFKLLEPLSPKRCRSENWPIDS